MSSLFGAIESATRAGPAMIVSLGRVFAWKLAFGMYLGAMLGVVTGAPLGHAATTADEAHLPEEKLDIDIRDTDREPVEQPYIPDELEEPVVDTGEPPSWYLDGIQMFVDAVIGVIIVTGNVTAQFAFENKWVPPHTIQVVGLVGFFGAFALRYKRIIADVVM